jgi:hypothetical protein
MQTNTGIITKIKPLYDDLISQGFVSFLEQPEFLRICNLHNWTDIYTHVYNKANEEASVNNPYAHFGIPGDVSHKQVLLLFLNALFEKGDAYFFASITRMIGLFLEWTSSFVVIEGIVKDLRSIGIPSHDEDHLLQKYAQYDADVLRKIRQLYDFVRLRARGNYGNEYGYEIVRRALINNPAVKPFLPEFIINSGTIDAFWAFIQPKITSYKGRDVFLAEAFQPLLDRWQTVPAVLEEAVRIDEPYVNQLWRKALARLQDDPEAAITSARTLIETVCKYILDSSHEEYDDGVDLPVLYKAAAARLKLSPEQHHEQIFKQILSGCHTVVTGLGSLRNKLGDAHGASQRRVKPAARHAMLAVNLAGSMSQFLLQTHVQMQIQ